MKAARCLVKLAAVMAVIGAAVCLVIRNWESIVDVFYAVVGKVKAKKEQYCCFVPSEYDDYDDGALK